MDRFEKANLMYTNASLQLIPIVAYNETHCNTIKKLYPLIAAPWFIGMRLFIKNQWSPDFYLDTVGVEGYNKKIENHHIKACKAHIKIITSIYETLKEIYAITNNHYFESIPVWLGLIINDFICYRIHLICIDNIFNNPNLKIANNNIKKHLIFQEEKFISKLQSGIKFENIWGASDKYQNYSALNTLIFICQNLKVIYPGFNTYLENIESAYKDYLKTLNSKLWCVTYIQDDGDSVYQHHTRGRLPVSKLSKYNKILFFKENPRK